MPRTPAQFDSHTASPAARANIRRRTTSVAPERWLRMQTVAESRAWRAKVGLPVPPRGLVVSRPKDAKDTAKGKRRKYLVERERRSDSAGIGVVLGPLLGTFLGFLAGTAAAYIFFG